MSANRSRWDYALLAGVCGLVLWLGLGSTRLWDQDEGYYASVAREMFDRGDWVVPTFNQELFAHKPPLMFWGMMTGFELFGVCEFATRWVSAIFGTGMVLLTYRLGRLLSDRRTALLGSLVLVSSLMFTVVARSATADVHLGFFVLLAITIWVGRAKESLGRPLGDGLPFPVTGLLSWFLIYLSVALAVLSKGPIGFAFPMAILGTLTLGWFWIRGEEFEFKKFFSPKRFLQATFSMRPWVGAMVLALVAGPWFWLVNQRTDGAFFAEFFGVQHLQRFSQPMDNHSGPIYYYIVSVLVGFFPWTSFAIPIGLHTYGVFRDGRDKFAWTVVAVWLFFYFLVFSLASTKLPNYIIPAYPAIALWIGSYFASWAPSSVAGVAAQRGYWRLAGWSFMAFSGVLLAGGTLALASRIGQPLVQRLELDTQLLPSIMSFAWLGGLLVVTGVVGLLLQRFSRERTGVALLAGLSIAWVTLIWQWLIPQIDRFQTPQQIAVEHLEPLDREPAVVGMFRPSMVFYSRGKVNFCKDDQTLEDTLSGDPPELVVVNQSSERAKQMLDERGYRVAESLDSFPKKGAITVFRK